MAAIDTRVLEELVPKIPFPACLTLSKDGRTVDISGP